MEEGLFPDVFGGGDDTTESEEAEPQEYVGANREVLSTLSDLSVDLLGEFEDNDSILKLLGEFYDNFTGFEKGASDDLHTSLEQIKRRQLQPLITSVQEGTLSVEDAVREMDTLVNNVKMLFKGDVPSDSESSTDTAPPPDYEAMSVDDLLNVGTPSLRARLQDAFDSTPTIVVLGDREVEAFYMAHIYPILYTFNASLGERGLSLGRFITPRDLIVKSGKPPGNQKATIQRLGLVARGAWDARHMGRALVYPGETNASIDKKFRAEYTRRFKGGKSPTKDAQQRKYEALRKVVQSINERFGVLHDDGAYHVRPEGIADTDLRKLAAEFSQEFTRLGLVHSAEFQRAARGLAFQDSATRAMRYDVGALRDSPIEHVLRSGFFKMEHYKSPAAVEARRVKEQVRRPDPAAVEAKIGELNARYAAQGSCPLCNFGQGGTKLGRHMRDTKRHAERVLKEARRLVRDRAVHDHTHAPVAAPTLVTMGGVLPLKPSISRVREMHLDATFPKRLMKEVAATKGDTTQLRKVFAARFYPLLRKYHLKPSDIVSKKLNSNTLYLRDQEMRTGQLFWGEPIMQRKGRAAYQTDPLKQLLLSELQGSDADFNNWLFSPAHAVVRQSPAPVPAPVSRETQQKQYQAIRYRMNGLAKDAEWGKSPFWNKHVDPVRRRIIAMNAAGYFQFNRVVTTSQRRQMSVTIAELNAAMDSFQAHVGQVPTPTPRLLDIRATIQVRYDTLEKRLRALSPQGRNTLRPLSNIMANSAQMYFATGDKTLTPALEGLMAKLTRALDELPPTDVLAGLVSKTAPDTPKPTGFLRPFTDEMVLPPAVSAEDLQHRRVWPTTHVDDFGVHYARGPVSYQHPDAIPRELYEELWVASQKNIFSLQSALDSKDERKMSAWHQKNYMPVVKKHIQRGLDFHNYWVMSKNQLPLGFRYFKTTEPEYQVPALLGIDFHKGSGPSSIHETRPVFERFFRPLRFLIDLAQGEHVKAQKLKPVKHVKPTPVPRDSVAVAITQSGTPPPSPRQLARSRLGARHRARTSARGGPARGGVSFHGRGRGQPIVLPPIPLAIPFSPLPLTPPMARGRGRGRGHAAFVPVHHPGFGPLLVAGPVQTEEEKAWEAFVQNNHPWNHNPAIRSIIQQNRHRHFFRYNHLVLPPVIEPIPTRHVAFRTRVSASRRGVFYEEIHSLSPHPNTVLTHQTELDSVSGIVDPLHFVGGTPSSLGSFIQLKSTPSVTHVLIKKGVQTQALRRLAEHIKSQVGSHPSRLLLKRSVKGRFIYKKFISSKQLHKITVDELLKKLLALVARKVKYTQLQLKPNQRGGKIWEYASHNISML